MVTPAFELSRQKLPAFAEVPVHAQRWLEAICVVSFIETDALTFGLMISLWDAIMQSTNLTKVDGAMEQNSISSQHGTPCMPVLWLSFAVRDYCLAGQHWHMAGQHAKTQYG